MRKIVSLFLIIGNVVCAQVGIGTTSPSSGAMLDITSTSSGVLIPRVTQTQRNAISSPTTGVLIYQTDNTPGFYYYDGSAWTPVGKDNLGNHTATQNINLGTTNWLSGDGGNEGISVGSSGRVGMGVTNAFEELHIHRATATPIFALFTNGNTGGVGFSDGFLVGINSNGSVALLNRENTNMMFSTNNVGRMIIDADGDIAIGDTASTSGAKFDIQGTDGGLLIPRLTQTQRDAIGSPPTGLLIYQTDNSPGFYYHNGTVWTGISAGAGGWGLTGNIGTTASNFIGTTDSQNFAIRTNNTERITVEADGDIGINITTPAIDVAIGDTDTGLNWNSDGNIDYMANNVVAAKMTDTGIFVRPQSGTAFNHELNIGDGDTGFDWTSDGNFSVMNNNTLTMAFSNNNRVGIGTTTPTDHLHLHEATATNNFIGFTDATTGTNSNTDGAVVGIFNDDLYMWNRENEDLRFGTNEVERMIITNDGRLGIGTSTPNARLHVASAAGSHTGSGRFFSNGTTSVTAFGSAARSHAIWAAGWVASDTGFLSYSDERIKKDITNRSTKHDLNLINQLNVVDYNYTDYRTYGSKNNIGFIAQEIKKVMPDAIKVQEEFIPNIYTVSYNVITDTNKTIIKLEKKYDVKIGDKLKLIVPDKGEQIVDIIQVEGNNITTSPIIESPEKVFVYGKQVDDFLAVEYDDVFTVSVSAIQELSKQIETLKQTNSKLKTQISKVDQLQSELEHLKEQLGIGL